MFPLIIGALVIVALLVSSSSEETVVRPIEPEPVGGGGSSTPPKTGGGTGTGTPKKTTYTVVSGDTASKIGVKFGKGGVYGELFAANPSKLLVRVYSRNEVGHIGEIFTTPDVDQVWSVGVKPTYLGRNFANLNIGEVLKLPTTWG